VLPGPAQAQTRVAPFDVRQAPWKLSLPLPPLTPDAAPGVDDAEARPTATDPATESDTATAADAAQVLATPATLTWRLPDDWPQSLRHTDARLWVTHEPTPGVWQVLPATVCPQPPSGEFREWPSVWREQSREPGRLVLDLEVSGPPTPGTAGVNLLIVQLDDRHRNLQVRVEVWRERSSPAGPGSHPPAETGAEWVRCGTGWIFDRTLPGHRQTGNRVDLVEGEPGRLRVALTGDRAGELELGSVRVAGQGRGRQSAVTRSLPLLEQRPGGDQGEAVWEFALGEEGDWIVGAELEVEWSGEAYHPVSLTIADGPWPQPGRAIREGAVWRFPGLAGSPAGESRQLAFSPVRGRTLRWTVVDRHSPTPLRVRGARVTVAAAWVSVERRDLPQPAPAALTLWLDPGRTPPGPTLQGVPAEMCPTPRELWPTGAFEANPRAAVGRSPQVGAGSRSGVVAGGAEGVATHAQAGEGPTTPGTPRKSVSTSGGRVELTALGLAALGLTALAIWIARRRPANRHGHPVSRAEDQDQTLSHPN